MVSSVVNLAGEALRVQVVTHKLKVGANLEKLKAMDVSKLPESKLEDLFETAKTLALWMNLLYGRGLVYDFL